MPIILESSVTSWSKVRLYWDNSLVTLGLTATSEEAGYEIENIYDPREINLWKATSTAYQTITGDAGAGNTYTVDYLAIANHNLNGVTIVVQYAHEDGTWHTLESYTVDTTGLIVRDYDSTAARKWRLVMGPFTAIPFMGLCIFGQRTELDYTYAPFDSAAENDKGAVVRSDNGYHLGTHSTYVEQTMKFNFRRVDATLWAKIRDFYDRHGMQNTIIGWERTEHATEVFMGILDAKRTAPFDNRSGTTRSVTMSFTGRKG